MRFYILSDLHLNEKVEDEKVSDRIKKICSKIRKSTDIGENILFIILGDIIDKGNGLSFDTASDNLNLIYNELKDYSVKFEFVPGNHDIESGSLCLFDKLISKYGSRHAYESVSVYSSVYENVNFIFADSTLSRDYKAPGRLNVKLIKENIKSGFLNILFCHHAISHGHGDPHDVIEDSATVLAELRSNGISFFFHAIDDYVKKVSVDKCPPKGTGTLVDGPTGSIASISDPIFLLQLERLLIVVFDPEFRDNTWRGLRNSLAKAFVNCGTVAYEETIEILMKHRPSVDVNETNYRYCNSIIEDIEHARKMLKDTPLALSETRRILIDVKRYY